MFPGKPAFTTTLTNGTSIAQGVFIEMFLTAELVFTVLMLAAEKSKTTFIAPGRCFSRSPLLSAPFWCLIPHILPKEEPLILSIPIVGIGLALFVAELAGMLITGTKRKFRSIADVCCRCILYRRLS